MQWNPNYKGDWHGEFYAAPIPAQQSPAGVPDECCATGQSCDYEVCTLNGEQQCKYCGKEHPYMVTHQLPAVVVPDELWVSCKSRLPTKSDADIAGNVICRWSNGEIVAIKWSDVEEGDDEWLYKFGNPSPRINEQDTGSPV
jgi:hypothetical protein